MSALLALSWYAPKMLLMQKAKPNKISVFFENDELKHCF